MDEARRAGRPIRSAGEAAAWFARPPADDGPQFLAILHPDDPRHRERLAASVIREIEISLDKGERLLVADVGTRMGEELAVFKSTLLSIPARVAAALENVSPAEAERMLSDEVESALRGLTADDPDTWPSAALTPPSPLDDGLDLETEIDDDAEYMPQLHPSDPRYRHHQAQAEQKMRELEKLWVDTIPLRHACATIKEQYDIVREHFASLPTRNTLELEHADTPDIVARKIIIEISMMLRELEKR